MSFSQRCAVIVADASRIMDSSAFDCQEDGQVCSAVSVSKKVMEDGEQTDDDDDEKVLVSFFTKLIPYKIRRLFALDSGV